MKDEKNEKDKKRKRKQNDGYTNACEEHVVKKQGDCHNDQHLTLVPIE